MDAQGKDFSTLLKNDKEAFVGSWLAEVEAGAGSLGRTSVNLGSEARKLAGHLESGIGANGSPSRFDAEEWAPLRAGLADLSAAMAAQGVTSGETSQFVLAIKKPVFEALRKQHLKNPEAFADGVWWASTLVDKMAQHTVTTFQRTREDIIGRQQEELLELSTPVIKLWDGVLAVPMIGTLDSSRTQLVMEALLQAIVETGSEIAIIDITGVPTVDTLVAQHLLKTVTAIRLMGAECLISGIRPQIAQTIVHLGIDLNGIVTKATLADALAIALKRSGYTISRVKA
jgi:rsbT co-antagonist protein RsbR